MRLAQVFATAAAEKRAAVIPYLTTGYPTRELALEVALAAAAAGADILEIGVPFSDPSADGPAIQRAMAVALAAGTGLPSALALVQGLRARGCQTPVVLFGYYNPIVAMGLAPFAARCAEVGVDAVLTVDLPMNELAELAAPLAAHGVGVVPLVAPTTSVARAGGVRAFQPAFVYAISMTGVTGSHGAATVSAARLAELREATGAPVAVGFGIRTPEDARRVAADADAVVVGSALMDAIAGAPPAAAPRRVGELVAALVQAARR